MASPVHQVIRNKPLMVFLLAVIYSFWLHYILVYLGVCENRVRPAVPAGEAAGWRTVGIRVWGWQLKNNIEEYAKQNALFRIPLSEINMAFRKTVGMRLFPDAENTLRLNNGHLVIPRERVDVQACGEQIQSLREFCASRGIPFLFVMTPYKVDSRDPELPEGMEDFSNDNADRFISQVASNGVSVLDLRSRISAAYTNFYEAYFQTDHHWKPSAGLWAAGQIVSELSRLTGAPIDEQILDPSRYKETDYAHFFLGSLGKKVTRAYISPDDFILVTPKFNTELRLRIPSKGVDLTGAFQDTVIDKSLLQLRDYYWQNPYEAYLQGDNPLLLLRNLQRPDGLRVLMLKDSFANVVIPFMALAVGSMDVMDLRYCKLPVFDYIRETKPDIVIVNYSSGSFRKASPIWQNNPLPVPENK